MRSFQIFFLSAVLALLATASVNAKVFTFDELNCRCEVPDTWVFQDVMGDLVQVVDIPHKRSF